MRQRTNIVWLVALSLCVVAGMAVAADLDKEEKDFLTKISDSGTAEIAFGRMAADRAENLRVKQFGQRMMADHQKVGMEVKQLALKQGIDLPRPMLQEQKDQAAKFSQLSGKEFDRAYMSYMLKEHVKEVIEFEHGGKMLKDQEIREWVTATLPRLDEHLTLAKNIAADLGIKP